jgi:hypothetical protein
MPGRPERRRVAQENARRQEVLRMVLAHAIIPCRPSLRIVGTQSLQRICDGLMTTG